MAKASTQTGSRAIRALWKDARGLHDDLSAATVADPDPNLERNGIKPGQWHGAPHDAIPPDCPVHVVGCDVDGNVWCRSSLGDLRCITDKNCNQFNVVRLFAPFTNYAYWAWPAFNKPKTDKETGAIIEPPKVVRVEHTKLFTCLQQEASKKPLFDPSKHHRGRGGWLANDGSFIWHSGKFLYRSTGKKMERMLPQQVDDYLYTRGAAIQEPWAEPVTQEESPALRILQEIRSWNWERPYLDPLLVLGWIATGFMAAALKERPILFTVGGQGVGKTTLRKLVKSVFNDGCLAASNVTAPFVYQKLKHDVLPVLIDELENQPGRSQNMNIIEIARISYSGDEMGRGSSDPSQAVSYTLRSSFWCSAIIPPSGMTSADKSRTAMLSLSRFDAGEEKKLLLKPEVDGRMILRQIMDGWAEFDQTLQQKWWGILAPEGLSSRDINTYGTLLAACELIVGPYAMEECGLPVFEMDKLRAVIGTATQEARSANIDSFHKCITHLFASTIDAWRTGEKPTVGGVLDDLANMKEWLKVDVDEARRKLAMVNLSVKEKGALGQPGDGPFLVVPANGPQLAKLFQGSDWEGGGWTVALKQGVRGGVVISDRKHGMVKINGAPQRCLLVDWTAFQRYAEEQ